MSSSTCEENPLDVPVIEKPIHGTITFNDLIIVISAISTAISCFLSLYLVIRHMTNYTKPLLQKQVIRIILMVPVYGILCTLSIAYYQQHIYLGAIYEFYESLVLAAFFLLLCNLLRADIPSLQRVFASLEPMKWIWPIRIWQLLFRCGRKRGQATNGLKWFHLIWVMVFQFCIVKFLGALAKMVTEAADVYCDGSKSTSHASIWISIVELISLVTCMLFLIQFYKQTKVALKEHRPLLKFIAIKLVIFLFYVQSFIISIIVSKGAPSKPTPYISYPSIAVGIPNVLLCIEMMGIATLHLWAYPWKPYQAGPAGRKPIAPSDEELSTVGTPTTAVLESNAGFLGWRAIVDVLNFSDIIASFFKGCMWLIKVRKIREQTVPLQNFGAEQNFGYNGSAEALEQWKTNDLGEALVAESRSRSHGQ